MPGSWAVLVQRILRSKMFECESLLVHRPRGTVTVDSFEVDLVFQKVHARRRLYLIL